MNFFIRKDSHIIMLVAFTTNISMTKNGIIFVEIP